MSDKSDRSDRSDRLDGAHCMAWCGITGRGNRRGGNAGSAVSREPAGMKCRFRLIEESRVEEASKRYDEIAELQKEF